MEGYGNGRRKDGGGREGGRREERLIKAIHVFIVKAGSRNAC